MKHILISLTLVCACMTQALAGDSKQVLDALYRDLFNREPDATAYQHFGAALDQGTLTVRNLVKTMLTSEEYKLLFYSEVGTREVVERLYVKVLGRKADDGGLKSFSEMLEQKGLEAVVTTLLDSPEYMQTFGDWGVPNHPEIKVTPPPAP
jgi:hypothetical protein